MRQAVRDEDRADPSPPLGARRMIAPQHRTAPPWQSRHSFARFREPMLFLAIGGTSALAYMALGVFFSTVGDMRPSLAIITTLALLIPPTYLAQRALTFRSNRPHASAFPRYAGTQAVGNALALLGSECFPTLIRAHPWLAYTVIAIGVAATNFFLLKLWTFRNAA